MSENASFEYGKKMLLKMGWKDGEGLGRDGLGINGPLQIPFQQNSSGIGSTEGIFHPWWEDAYSAASVKIVPNITLSKKKKITKNALKQQSGVKILSNQPNIKTSNTQSDLKSLRKKKLKGELLKRQTMVGLAVKDQKS